MGWVKVSTTFTRHPKALAAGPTARHLYLCSLMWAGEYNTDGQLPAYVLNVLAIDAGIAPDEVGDVADKLVEVGLWERSADGWQVHDWVEWQATAEERDRRAELTRERQRRYAERRAAKVVATRESRVSNALVTLSDTDADAEVKQEQEKSRVDTPNVDPSPSPSIGEPPVGGRSQTPDEGFARFWDAYPKRDGRKVGKAQALTLWQKLKPPDRALALVAVAHYAAERGGPGQLSPEDAQRWLRNRRWAEFADPPDAQSIAASNGRPQRVPTAELLAAHPDRS